MKLFFTSCVLIFFFAIQSISFAQTDSLMGVAKELMKHDKYAEAEQIYIRLLNNNDNNNDVRFALGLLYSWNKQYDKAENIFTTVLTARPTSKEVYIAALNNLLWADKNEQALTLADTANKAIPDDADILIRKAKALIILNRLIEAQTFVEAILAKDPNNQEAKDLLESIKIKNQKNSIGIGYTFDYFTDGTKPWHLTFIQYSRKTKMGSIIGRVNYANRFGSNGYQLELDAFPSLSKKSYLYVNIGYSPTIKSASKLFPDYRLGCDYYRNLPKAFEASVGMRYLKFSSSDVFIFTGHVGKYIGNYWLSFRPFVVPNKKNISVSAFLLARRYFENVNDYIGLQIGYGSSPDDRSILLTGKNDLHLVAYKFRLSYNHLFSNKWDMNISGGYTSEEFFATRYRIKLTIDFSLNYLF